MHDANNEAVSKIGALISGGRKRSYFWRQL